MARVTREEDSQLYRRDRLLVVLLASLGGILAFLYYYSRGEVLLYGDAVAHLNIARRVVDSRTPGLRQLGTVWLPLPHLLMLPFISSDKLWRTGIAGSIFSVVGYVVACCGIFRLGIAIAGRGVAWLAFLIFAANPNLLYLQSTAMTESIYLAAFIWAAVHFADFARELMHVSPEAGHAARSLLWGSFWLAAAALTRYDGWFLCGACWGVALLAALTHRSSSAEIARVRGMKRRIAQALLITALVPVAWLAYNYSVFGNALEFATGPYSAKGIEARTSSPGMPHHPGYDSLRVSTQYFTKAARLNLGEGRWPEWFFVLAIAGALVTCISGEWTAALILWSVLPFYAFSIAHGGVPIFIPTWWPFSYYNVRYGIQLLPAFAIALAMLTFALPELVSSRRVRDVAVLAIGLLVTMSYYTAWKGTPVSLREAQVNSIDRIAFQSALAQELAKLPPDSSILMYTSAHIGALQQAGVHLARTVNEANYYEWRAAMADPARATDYVIATDNDEVAQALARHNAALPLISVVQTSGNSGVLRARIYKGLPKQ